MKLDQETIIHPDLMRELAGFYPSLCRIGNLTETQDQANQPVYVWVDNERLRGIKCYVQPASGAETRTRQAIVEVNQWLIGLDGYFPTIVQSDQANVDDVIYNILRVAHDDHATATYLTCEVVS